jgi:hypothetical protein
VELTWYQATRHSFVSRNLKNGASLDEVSAALGHSSPVVTRTYYDRFVRKVFSPEFRQGLARPSRLTTREVGAAKPQATADAHAGIAPL